MDGVVVFVLSVLLLASLTWLAKYRTGMFTPKLMPDIAPVQPTPAFGRRHNLFTPTEMSFYKALEPLVMRSQKLLFAKVRLEDLVYVRSTVENQFGHRNRIKSRHIDFVICDSTAKPLLAIELDDYYHRGHKMQEHDAIKNRVLQEAGLPLLRVPVRSRYDESTLTSLIREKLTAI